MARIGFCVVIGFVGVCGFALVGVGYGGVVGLMSVGVACFFAAIMGCCLRFFGVYSRCVGIGLVVFCM